MYLHRTNDELEIRSQDFKIQLANYAVAKFSILKMGHTVDRFFTNKNFIYALVFSI